MFSKFNCKISESFYHNTLNQYLTLGQEKYNETQTKSHECLKKFIFDNGHVDGSALKDHWFHVEKADIFISHSHKDINKVKAFAGWLYSTFKLSCFIDSCVWGYCDDLLKEIDNEYCKNKNNTYDYQLRNYTTSHVHTMLSSALSEMIDKTECIIFFNTPNSIFLNKEMENEKSDRKSTLSPWIYHELSMAHMIRTSLPKRPLQENFSRRDSTFKDGFNTEYKVDNFLKEMIPISDEILTQWENNYKPSKNALDALYAIVPQKSH